MLKLNLGCSDRQIPGYVGVDLWTPPWATESNFQKADLRHIWPWADGSVDEIIAHDCIEHLVSKIDTMNEIHRVLKPGGKVDIIVPTTDGRGADQDPTHVSYWNRNSFFYFTANDPHYDRFHDAYGIKGSFKVESEQTHVDTDIRVSKLHIVLTAVKNNMEASAVRVPDEQKIEAEVVHSPATHPAPPPIFSILHATAHRLPTGWIDSWKAWSANATHPERVEYILCVHNSDIEKVKEGVASLGEADGISIIVTAQGNRYCAVDNWNTAAKASHGSILIMGADDFFPPINWDGALINAVTQEKKQLHDEFAIHVNVGSGDPNLASHPIMSRALYERWGYFLYPEYEGVYCDNDFTDHANLEGVMIDARNLPFDHRHPIKNGTEAFRKALTEDIGYAAQNTDSRYQSGHRIYMLRKAAKFSNQLVATKSELPNLFMCYPGESFSSHWVSKWTELLMSLPAHFNLFPCNSYCSNVTTTRIALAHAAMANLPKSDFILWIDDDNLVTPTQVMRLYQDLLDHPELDAVAGWCWIQGDTDGRNSTRVSCGLFHADGSCQGLSPATMLSPGTKAVPRILEIAWTGFPVILMRRSCLEKAGERGFSPIPTLHARFGFMGEDVAFCMAAAKNGARFAVARDVQVPHLKTLPIPNPDITAVNDFAVSSNALTETDLVNVSRKEN